MDSAEYDRWATAIAAGDWLGSEAFFQAPLYPYLLAIVYRVVGHSLDAVYWLQAAMAVAGLALVARAASRALSPRHGVAAAALGAVYMPAVFHDVQLAKESIALPLAALLIERLTAARERPGIGIWMAAGGVLGLLGLLRENALVLVPFLAPLAIAGKAPKPSKAARLAAFVVGVALPLLPVAARNAAVGGGFLPTTFQGGVNLWIGNNPEADGTYRPLVPGKQVPRHERAEAERLAEEASGRPLSGAEVSRFWLRRTLDWAASEPTSFAALQLRKLGLYLAPYEWPDAVDYAWMRSISPPLALPGLEWGGLLALAAVGLWLRRRRLASLQPVVLFEAGWLVATVAFFVFSRYRLPAVAGLCVLGSVPIVGAVDAWREGRRRAAKVATAALLLAVWIPRAVAPGPRTDLVEFNLGRLAEEAGDRASARRHYTAALAADPSFFLAAMNLGTLAGRAGDLEESTRFLELAVELEPRSDDAWANLGAARLAAGDLEGASRAIDRALEINPRHRAANRNRELVEHRAGGTPRQDDE